jgi:hypothetical protein
MAAFSFPFSGQLLSLEIARGHDGFLRGSPEPVLLVGAYLVVEASVYVVGRTLHRFVVKTPFPSEATADRAALPSCAVELGTAGSAKWVVLAIALEQDGGEDVQRLFGAIEHHDSISVWAPESGDIEPVTLGALPETAEWATPRPVHVSLGGRSAADGCSSDKWIGAVIFWLRGHRAPQSGRFRLPFLAADGRNDWTAIAEISR